MAKGIRFQPQSTNPLPNASDLGLWVNTSSELVLEQGGTTQNVTQILTGVVEGTAITYIAKSYVNNSGSMIPVHSVVYSPVVGEIELADGNNVNKFRVIGLTVEPIADGDSGLVAISGIVSGVSAGLTHNSYVYLGNTPGILTDTPPNTPSGFNVVRLGVVDDDSILLQIQHIGTLA